MKYKSGIKPDLRSILAKHPDKTNDTSAEDTWELRQHALQQEIENERLAQRGRRREIQQVHRI